MSSVINILYSSSISRGDIYIYFEFILSARDT